MVWELTPFCRSVENHNFGSIIKYVIALKYVKFFYFCGKIHYYES